jgi:cob(I)alamin adenosyltransferase
MTNKQIYTRTGDKGMTSLLGGKRVSKSDLQIECLGSIDELNSLIGISISNLKTQNSNLKMELIGIQKDLIKISSLIADAKYIIHDTKYFLERIEKFENLIDQLTAKMPSLNTFILPGGGETGAMLHFARSICRRAERNIVKLSQKSSVRQAQDKNQKLETILIYFNRLSDLLFTMARFANFKEKRKEII